jgi:hypothetical protein
MQSCIEYPQNRAVQPFSFPLFRFRFNLKQKLFDQFQQKWRSDMNNSSKVLCYKNFKDCFEFEVVYRREEMDTVVHNGIHHQSHFYHICYMSYCVSQ